MVIIEPTSGWARKMNEKYQQPKNFIDPGSAGEFGVKCW